MEYGLNHFDLWTGLLGGLALFLFGMDHLTRALKVVAGSRMKTVLAKLTANRFIGALTGAVVTAIIQSSSVTTVILIGFISAGLMSMAQSVPVIMGANIGSTVTAQVLAFKVTKAALPMIAVGFGFYFLSKRDVPRQAGGATMGLGLVFYGMSVMSGAMAPLRDFQPFIDLMVSMDAVWLGIVIGAVFTALIQSSAATTGIVLVLGGQGLISLTGAIALILGANIGTCATAWLASIGKSREAWRAAFVHIFFNIAGALIFVWFIPYLADLVVALSPAAPAGVPEDARRMAEMPRQIANAHTIFNIANTFILIWFAPHLARLAMRVLPDRPEEVPQVVQPKYLDKGLLETPALALDMARLEIGRVATRVEIMLNAALPVVLKGTREELEDVADMDQDVDALHDHIIDYLSRLTTAELSERENDQLLRLMEAVRLLESIGDMVETNMVNIGIDRLAEGIAISPQTTEVLGDYHEEVVKAFQMVAKAIRDNDPKLAKRMRSKKSDMAEQTKEAIQHQVSRLRVSKANKLETYTREMEIIETLAHVFRTCRRLARTMLDYEERQADEKKKDRERREALIKSVTQHQREKEEAKAEAKAVAAKPAAKKTPAPKAPVKKAPVKKAPAKKAAHHHHGHKAKAKKA